MAKTRKQSRLEKLNRIESLHINLLHQILSFLPTQQVVQTSVLSKTWRDIWRSIPCLYFHKNLCHTSSKFESIVDTVLAQRDEGCNVEKFHLNLVFYDDNQKIGSWLEYAARHNNQILFVDPRGRMLEDWTCQVSYFKSLVHLTLCNCYISLRTPTLLPNLKIMELYTVDFVDDEQDQIPLVSLCPSLESLVMHYVKFPSLVEDNKLIISAPKLKKLDVHCYFPLLVEISAPNLVSLKLVNSDYTEKGVVIRFDNGTGISMVEHAHIRVKLGDSESVVQLFRVLENVRFLELYCNVLNSVAKEMQKNLSGQECIQIALSKLKQLKLHTSFDEGDIYVINTLLKHSSSVETLTLTHEGNAYFMLTEYPKLKVWFKYEIFHLKKVVIHKFLGWPEEMRFVKFLLGNAPTLKMLIITLLFPARKHNPLTNSQRNVIFNRKKRQLYGYKCASSSVDIKFTQE